jgi:hypothetical protein
MSHRPIIEDLVEQFNLHANRGSLHTAADVIPQIIHQLMDMIEGKPVSAPKPAEPVSGEADTPKPPKKKKTSGGAA